MVYGDVRSCSLGVIGGGGEGASGDYVAFSLAIHCSHKILTQPAKICTPDRKYRTDYRLQYHITHEHWLSFFGRAL